MARDQTGTLPSARCAGRLAACTLLAGLLPVLLAAGPVRAQDCCPPSVVAQTRWRSDASSTVGGPVWITADGLGNVHAGSSRDGVAGYFLSRDGGTTWAPGDFTLADGASVLRVAATDEGVLLAAYLLGETVFARTSFDAGRTWTDPVTAVVAGRSLFPGAPLDVQVRSNGLAAVRVQVTSGSFLEPLSVAASTDHGLTWSPPAVENPWSSDVMSSPLLALDDETVVFAFQDGDAVFTRRTVDAGRTWEPPVQVNLLPAFPSRASLGSSGAGHFQVAYFHQDALGPDLVRVAASRDGAATWQADEETVDEVGLLGEIPRFLSWAEGSLLLGGWFSAGNPGRAVAFSAGHGTAGTWSAPSFFATGGDGLHHVRFAVGPGSTLAAAHDDYRFDGSGCPPDAGGTCESIFLQLSCLPEHPWAGPELRLDTDGPGEGPHSEDPELVASSDGRLQVIWIDGEHPDGPIVHHVAVELGRRLPLTVRQVSADDCLPDRHLLEVGEDALADCGEAAIQWFEDGEPLAGATDPTLQVSHVVSPPGEHEFHYELDCTPSPECPAVSEAVSLVVEPPERIPPPAVGGVLFVRDHGSPHGPTATAVLDWDGDEGAPRGLGDHYHVRRGTEPFDLRFLSQVEPLAVTSYQDATPAAARRPFLHCYRITAADRCELESSD